MKLSARRYLPDAGKSQSGINMIDLMMWLVIAALLLAAAIQGASYYQKAAYLYHMKSDLTGAGEVTMAKVADNGGNLSKAVVDLGTSESKWSKDVSYEVRTSTNAGAKPYIVATHPGVPDLDAIYIFEDCGNKYAIGVNVIPKNGNVDLAACGISAADPAAGGGSGTPSGPATGLSGTGMLASWGYGQNGELGNGPLPSTTTYGALYNKSVTSISSGSGSSCVVAEGKAYCWGDNTYGQLGTGDTVNQSQPTAVAEGAMAGKTVTAIESRSSQTCAIADGAAYCWGGMNLSDGYPALGNGTNAGSLVPVAVTGLAGKTVTKISPSDAIGVVDVTTNTCVVASGGAYCWGRNNDGALGNGNTTSSYAPVAVTGALVGKTVTDISGSTYENSNYCAVATDGKAYCWGYGGNGELGRGSFSSSSAPVAVTSTGVLSGKTVTSVSVARTSACVVASDSQVYCWGWGPGGELGNGTDGQSTVPVAVDTSGVMAGKNITKIAAGGQHVCAIANDGTSYCWGATTDYSGSRPILGNNSYDFNSYSPVAVYMDGGLKDKTMTSISAGPNLSCGVANNAAYCWGAAPTAVYTATVNYDYSGASIASPGKVGGSTSFATMTVSKFSAGGNHACAISSGQAYCWGANWNGEVGNGNKNDAPDPVLVDVSGVLAGKTLTDIAAGPSNTCAVADGEVYCWGDGSSGQLGNGTMTGSSSPVAVDTSGVLSGKTIVSVASGSSHSCAVDDANKIYCWGANWSQQLGHAGGDSQVPVAVDMSGIPAGAAITKITSASEHTCVIAGGDPYCWGANWIGQIGDGSTTDAAKPVAVNVAGIAGASGKTTDIDASDTTCAVINSAAYCWGKNNSGEIGNGAPSSWNAANPIPVAVDKSIMSGAVSGINVGDGNACAVSLDKGYCWGAGGSGSLGQGEKADSLVPVPVDVSGMLSGKKLTGISLGGETSFATYE